MSAVFSPLAFPEGLVLYDLSTSLPPPSHLALAPFEVYREPFIVLGIADGMNLQCGSVLGHPSEQDQGRYSSNRNNGTEALTRNLADLSREFPRALVHQILVFDHDGLPLPQGIYPVPSPAKSRTTTVKTVMCDMTSRLLAEMTPYAKSLQSFSSLDSPRVSTKATSNGPASALPAHMGALSRDGSAVRSSRSASPAAERSHSTHRTSMPARMTSSVETRPSTPGIRAASPPNGRNTPSPTINGAITAKSPPRGPDVERTRAESRDRVFVNGSGVGNFGERERNKGKGRIGVVVGAMYLLAGQWPDAVKELTQSATIARASSDYLWHAKALDYLLVCLLMYAWAGMDFRVSLHVIDESNSYKICQSR